MKSLHSIAFAVAVLTCAAGSALAQSAPPPPITQPTAEQVANSGAEAVSKPDDPTGSGSFLGFTVSQANSKIAAKKDFLISNLDLVTISGSVPLTANTSNLKITSLDAMASGFALQVGTKHVTLPPPQHDTVADDEDFCTNVFWPAVETARAKAVKANDKKAIKKLSTLVPSAAGAGFCSGTDVKVLGDSTISADFNKVGKENKHTKLWGLTAGVGYIQHDYYDVTSLAKENINKFPFSIGAFWGVEPRFDNTELLVLTYQHQIGALDNKEKIACPPGTTNASSCVYGSIGAPANQVKDLVGVEFRQTISNGFAFKAAPTYDVHNKIWAIDFPVFFIPIGGKLSGGLDFSWKSNPKTSSIGLFLAQDFNNLFTGM